jgi:hypothetical protein
MGQTFSMDDQMKVLVEKYLGIVNPNYLVDEDLFVVLLFYVKVGFSLPYSILEQSENCHA